MMVVLMALGALLSIFYRTRWFRGIFERIFFCSVCVTRRNVNRSKEINESRCSTREEFAHHKSFLIQSVNIHMNFSILCTLLL